jgi:hypothetical protein
MNYIQHCFICRPSDSTVTEDAGIEHRTVASTALAVRRSNHSARSHPCTIMIISYVLGSSVLKLVNPGENAAYSHSPLVQQQLSINTPTINQVFKILPWTPLPPLTLFRRVPGSADLHGTRLTLIILNQTRVMAAHNSKNTATHAHSQSGLPLGFLPKNYVPCKKRQKLLKFLLNYL